MASRIELMTVTVPAGTALANPFRTKASFNDGIVDRLEMRWPPGPSGLVGLRIGHSGQVVIPDSGAGWIVTDDESIVWSMEDYPTANAWFVDGYNTDVNDHTVYLRWLMSEIPAPVAARAQLIPIT